MSNISIIDRISERQNRMEEKYFSSKLKQQMKAGVNSEAATHSGAKGFGRGLKPEGRIGGMGGKSVGPEHRRAMPREQQEARRKGVLASNDYQGNQMSKKDIGGNRDVRAAVQKVNSKRAASQAPTGKHPLGVTGYSASVPNATGTTTQNSHSKNFAGKKVSSPRPPQPPRAGQQQRGRRDDEQHSQQNFSTTTKSKFNTIDQYGGT